MNNIQSETSNQKSWVKLLATHNSTWHFTQPQHRSSSSSKSRNTLRKEYLHLTLWMLWLASAAMFSLSHFGFFKKNEAGNLETISYNTNDEKNSRRHVHVALYRDRGDVDGLASHYNAVVSKNKNKGHIYIDLQSQEVSGSGPPSPFDVPTPVPSPSYGKDDFDPTYEYTELFAWLQQWTRCINVQFIHSTAMCSIPLRIKTHRASSGSVSGKVPLECIVMLQNWSQIHSQASSQTSKLQSCRLMLDALRSVCLYLKRGKINFQYLFQYLFLRDSCDFT